MPETNIQANLFQLLSHARPAIAAKAKTRLFFDVRQRDQNFRDHFSDPTLPLLFVTL